MDAHVLHIGVDDCHRVAVLRSVGYRVEECASLLKLASTLERARGADAIFLSESDDLSPEKTILLARERSAAPLILFRSSNRETTDKAFDLVIEPLTSPRKWLREVDALVEWSRGARARSLITPQLSMPTRKARILKWDWERTREYPVNSVRAWTSLPGGN